MVEGKQDNGDGRSSEKSGQTSPPAINLPKGGGAIRSMGEKFAANPVTGTGSMTVPIATSPGRSGFGPQLSLSYDSGAGNGPFGFGWSLSLPSITRKTDKGLPQYLDTTDSDVFILSGAEDLVPVYRQDPDGTWVAGHAGFQRDADGFWVRDPSGRLVVQEDERGGYRVRRYRPRIEGLFACIERWTNTTDATDVFWRSISKDNILTLYGHDANSRIADPLDASRIFSWLICESRDDKGNGIRYRYKKEDNAYQPRPGQADPFTQAHQLNRGLASDARRTAQRYLQRVLYGNLKPLLDAQGQRPRYLDDLPNPPTDTDADWLFEVRFDYGELDDGDPTGQPEKSWLYRPDAFSIYRSGFEVRTCRRCERVLMLHHIPDPPAGPDRAAQPGYHGVVRSTDFTYDDELDTSLVTKPVYSFLKQVVQTGWKQEDGSSTRRSLPPVEFEYTEPIVQDTVEEVDSESLENLPIGVDDRVYQWTDLHGEGIPGILSEQSGTWFYKRNWSPLPDKLPGGSEVVRAKFSALETVALKPNLTLSGGVQLMDLAGDGQPDLVMLDGPMPGLYEHDEAEGWDQFRPFTSRLTRDMRDPNLKFVDLDGDGHADVLISENDAFVWHPSLAEAGFGPARRVAQALDEEKGPRIVFANGTQSIYLADLSGDGLTDIVRIRNGEVCYWPNLGYGRFGAKVTMDNAPWFDNPDQFDHKRIRLADIDGSGTTDIIYLHRDGVRLYFNQSGNSWSQPHQLKVFPRVEDVVSIVPTDLLGNGTACLVWSSPLPGDARRPMRYVNLMGGRKPHLLIKTINNLGAETRVDYAPSTKFYLQDKRDGKPWITRLPFPVHVVERVETFDHISRNRFVTRYAYHHGYFDGEEREFRGFGMVEQWDTEQIGALTASGTFPQGDNIAAASHVPPVHTKTWFHTGVYDETDEVSRHFATEYYGAPEKSDPNYDVLFDAHVQTLLPDTVIPSDLTLEEEREACRALKGSMLRQEVYADDADQPGATPQQIQRARTPYTVTEQNFTIQTLQSRGGNRHAVFFTHAREALSYHYERNPTDPRIQHALTLEADDYGNVLKQAAIGYGRRTSPLAEDWDRKRQTTALLTYTENRVTNAIESIDTHRNPLPCEAITFELTGYPATGSAGRYHALNFVEPDPARPTHLRHKFTAPEVPYEATASGNQRRRPIECLRTLYRRDDLSGFLPLGEIEPLALSGESYKLAFTPGLLAQVFQRPRQGQAAEPLLPDRAGVLGGQGGNRGGYLPSQTMKADGRFPATDADDHWWIPSGQSFFSANPADNAATELAQVRQHFFLPRRYRDPFGQDAFVNFDAHGLLMVETRDAVGNRVTVHANDYRVLQPRLVSDPNRNQTEVAFDTLGMVVGTAVMGKPAPAGVEGDRLTGFVIDLTQTQLDAFFDVADPHATAPGLLRDATTRIVYDLDRFRRTQQDSPNDPTKWQPACAATLARETHASSPLPPQGLKIQVSFSYSDGFGREIQKKIQAEPGPVVNGGLSVNPRWVGSGWTIFNNKGKPVRQYEPFFSATHSFEFGVQVGVSPVLFYDPVERVIATIHPNHTYEKVRFDPWQQTTYDVNDTCAPLNSQTGDPRTDPDIQGYVANYFSGLAAQNPPVPWQTWYQQRQGGGATQWEQEAATKAAAHADTPTTAHLDALGRTFLTIAHNGQDANGNDVLYRTSVKFDIEGNQQEVRDAKLDPVTGLGRIVMQYDYDLLSTVIHQKSIEAPEQWMLHDVLGKPIRVWKTPQKQQTDPEQCFATAYDALRRPIKRFFDDTGRPDPTQGILFEQITYGESLGAAAAGSNLRGRIVQQFDGAGIVTNIFYDFKGNLLDSSRQLTVEYQRRVDWKRPPNPTDTYSSQTQYDALNRPISMVSPHTGAMTANVTQPVYNEAGLLNSIDVSVRGAPSVSYVKNIDYNEKGQRTKIEYGNGAVTTYGYDPLTFRLTSIATTRPARGLTQWKALLNKPTVVQDLQYTYDPAGNITHVIDRAHKSVIYNGQQVDPESLYTYDAVYRLIAAQGREHIGQMVFDRRPPDGLGRDYPFLGIRTQMSDLQAIETYGERYEYDEVGNIAVMRHSATNNPWTRGYDYRERSLIEPGKVSNRLSRTSMPGDNLAAPQLYSATYTHDEHGCITRMDHLQAMDWDFKDQLQHIRQGTMQAYYVYDAAGQRLRKRVEKNNGALVEERLYLGGIEVFRQWDATGPLLDRETLHVMDDKQRAALIETRTMGNERGVPTQLIRYQFSNHLGSACLELDEQADLISYEEYHPYGTSSYQVGRSGAEVSLKRYRYTGSERDEESGLYYSMARYYAPWLGRWTSSDPIGIRDDLNGYRYCRSSPVVYIDPLGMAPPDPPQDGIQTTVTAPRLDAATANVVRDFQEGVIKRFAGHKGGPPGNELALTDFGKIAEGTTEGIPMDRIAQGEKLLVHIHPGNTPYPSGKDIRYLIETGQTEHVILTPSGVTHVQVNLGSGESNATFYPYKGGEAQQWRLSPTEGKGYSAVAVTPAPKAAAAPSLTSPSPSSGFSTSDFTSGETANAGIKVTTSEAQTAAVSLTDKGKMLLYEAPGFMRKAGRVLGYLFAVGGAWNATEEADKGYDSVPSEVWLTEFGILTVAGLVDNFGVAVKSTWGDWEYGDFVSRSFSNYGMSPLQRDIAQAMQKK